MRFADLIVSTVLLAEFKRVKHDSLEVVVMCRLLIQIVNTSIRTYTDIQVVLHLDSSPKLNFI